MPPATFHPVYVLHGSDGYLLDHHRAEIRARVVGEADPQLCVARFDATAELADVLDELRTLPFLAPCRLVRIEDADAFVSTHRGALEDYLAKPSETSALVLEVSTWRKTTRLAKRVAEIGKVFECSVPQKGRLGKWLGKAAAARKKRWAPGAADLLAEWIGADLAALDGEVEKLSLYVGERDTITAEDVAALVTATAGPDAFDLTNAITAGQAGAALRALGGMLHKRGEEFRTLGLIGWHLRRALQVQQAIADGASPTQAVRAAHMPPPQQRALLDFLQRRSLRTLQTDFRRLLKTDLAMKSGTDPRAALQELVVELCT